MKSIKEVIVNKEIAVGDELSYKEIENSNCATGDKDFLIDKLKESFQEANSIDIIVAFLMESGVKLLAEDLKAAIHRGVKIRLLTGNYLNITQPQALYLLRDILGDKVDLRFYNEKNRSFHPKAYIFNYEKEQKLFILFTIFVKSLAPYKNWNSFCCF